MGSGVLVHLERLPFPDADAFVAFTGLDPRPDDSGHDHGRRRLSKRGPSELHCPIQDFSFDEQGLLQRLDYTAQVVGGWARATHPCAECREFDGLKIPTLRCVLPMPFGLRPLPGPVIVDITVRDFHPVSAAPTTPTDR